MTQVVAPSPLSDKRLSSRVWDAYRSAGAREVIRRALFQVAKYDPHYLYALCAQKGPDSLPANLTKLINRMRTRLQVEWLNKETTHLLSAYLTYRNDLSAAQVNAWLQEGHATVVVRYEGNIVGDGWLALQSFPLPNGSAAQRLKQPSYAFTFLANVNPEYRGLGVLPVLIEEQLRVMSGHGKTTLIGTVVPTNMLSIRSVEKMGFRRVGTLHVWWVLGKKWARVSLQEEL